MPRKAKRRSVTVDWDGFLSQVKQVIGWSNAQSEPSVVRCSPLAFEFMSRSYYSISHGIIAFTLLHFHRANYLTGYTLAANVNGRVIRMNLEGAALGS